MNIIVETQKRRNAESRKQKAECRMANGERRNGERGKMAKSVQFVCNFCDSAQIQVLKFNLFVRGELRDLRN